MIRLLLLILCVAACGGAKTQTLTLVNRTPRGIAEIYVFPAGAAAHGASRGKLAAGASMTVQMKQGNVEIEAISDLIIVDDHHRDKMTASSTLQLNRPLQVVFHDENQPPPDLSNKNVIGIGFQLMKAPPSTEESAPEAPPPSE